MAFNASTLRLILLAASLAAVAAGCAACRQCSSECGDECPNGSLTGTACSIFRGTLADDVMCGQGCFSQGRQTIGTVRPVTCGPDCANCGECFLCPFGLGDHCCCDTPTAGPPPVRYRPPMPPKFLPVPTAPTVSPVRPDAPEQFRGEVETGFEPRLTSPGRN